MARILQGFLKGPETSSNQDSYELDLDTQLLEDINLNFNGPVLPKPAFPMRDLEPIIQDLPENIQLCIPNFLFHLVHNLSSFKFHLLVIKNECFLL